MELFFSTSSPGSSIWLFDATGANNKNVTPFTKNYQVGNFESNDCKGWHSFSGTNSGVALKIQGSTTKYLDIGWLTCSTLALIACVSN